MLEKKKSFLKKKRENRNENLTATVKESEYTALVVSEREHQLTVGIITQKIYNILQCCYPTSQKGLLVLYGE